MTGPEHYRAAEQLLDRAGRVDRDGLPRENSAQLLATATVHGLLAAAAAVGGLDLAYTRWHSDREGWKSVVSPEEAPDA